MESARYFDVPIMQKLLCKIRECFTEESDFINFLELKNNFKIRGCDLWQGHTNIDYATLFSKLVTKDTIMGKIL